MKLIIFFGLLILATSANTSTTEPTEAEMRQHVEMLRQRYARAPEAMPVFKDTDVVEVYLLEGVISFFDKWNKIFSLLEIYHAGLGFMNLNTGQNVTVEYYVQPPYYLSAVFPIVHNPGDNCVLEWHNEAGAFVENHINHDVWKYGGEFKVSTISGKIFNEFTGWLGHFNDTDPGYNFFTVNDRKAGQVYMTQHTCMDFAWDCMDELHRLGATFSSEKYPKVYAYIYSHKPVGPVNPSDPAIRKKMCKFYGTFSKNNSTSTWAELIKVLAFPGEDKYVYSFGSYYLLSMEFPYIGWSSAKFPLPGHESKSVSWKNAQLEMEQQLKERDLV